MQYRRRIEWWRIECATNWAATNWSVTAWIVEFNFQLWHYCTLAGNLRFNTTRWSDSVILAIVHTFDIKNFFIRKTSFSDIILAKIVWQIFFNWFFVHRLEPAVWQLYSVDSLRLRSITDELKFLLSSILESIFCLTSSWPWMIFAALFEWMLWFE